ncbi:MAG: hypothetical protein R2710_26425 [Acidimicrobiales bacterium]
MRQALTANSAAALMSVLALYLPILLVPAMIDDTESGLFALVFRFVALPAAFVGGAVQRTLPRMARDVTISRKREWVAHRARCCGAHPCRCAHTGAVRWAGARPGR